MTLFEPARAWAGTATRSIGTGTPVDTGFIVYNEVTYPNLTALFRHLDVPTQASNMSFAVSKDDGRLEYSGADPIALFAQKRNLIRPRFWAMLLDILRFFHRAPRDLGSIGSLTLDEYLDRAGFGSALREDYLYPMAAAIWSTPAAEVGVYPAESFIRFFNNHGLLQGDRAAEMAHRDGRQPDLCRAPFARDLGRDPRRLRGEVTAAARRWRTFIDAHGRRREFDQVVIGAHADQALRDARRPDAEGARIARRLPIRRQQRRPAHRRERDAESARGLVELELHDAQRRRRATISP